MEDRRRDAYALRFAAVLDHVRTHPVGDLRLESLARLAHFSPYHFHRVFTAVVGETVAVFVRRARLERAVQLMRAAPRRALGSIALDAGFGSASDFGRAFRRHYGLAPSRWNRRDPLVFRSDGDDAEVDHGPHRDLIARDVGEAPTVELADLEARRLAFVRVRRPFEPGALQRGYEQLRGWLARRGLDEVPGELRGMSWDDVEVTPPDRIRYDLACPVPADVEASEGVGVRESPLQRVATARARGDLARVARVWHHLYHHWLPSSRFEPDHHPAFERYHTWPETLGAGGWDLDCCIPVVSLRGPR